MDAERFDHLTHRISSGKTRRQALSALGAVAALWTQRGRAAQLGPPPCGSAGKVCTMLAGCCNGLTCVTSAINTNYGVCVSGGDGGTVASGTSLVSPFSESAQSSGTVDSPTSTSTAPTATDTTTTSTTDPKAERQAKLQERRSRRSTRRNKIQSRRTTRGTSRKSRREDAANAAVLAAGPELALGMGEPRKLVGGEENGHDYDVVEVTNLSDIAVRLNKIQTVVAPIIVADLKRSLAPGESVGLAMGIQNGDLLPSDEEWWSNQRFCLNNPADGFRVSAAFSNDVENRVYTIMCDGSGNGLASGPAATGNRKKRKRNRKHQAAARGKKRKQHKKDN